MSCYRRRPVPVEAVMFLQAGDHPQVESRWALERPWRSGVLWDHYEGEPYASPLCSVATLGAVEIHHLVADGTLFPVTPGDWIVTEHGETRVVSGDEFERLYEIDVDALLRGPELVWEDPTG